MAMRLPVSVARVCNALERLHTATAVIMQLHGAPPGTPLRVREVITAQMASAVDANRVAP
jgi:hypothetical protein